MAEKYSDYTYSGADVSESMIMVAEQHYNDQP